MHAVNPLLVSLKTLPWQRTLREWLTIDAPVLIYMFKATVAALLALWISMRLNLPDPRTAIFTVFIVMQPQSGLVFSKSYYRVLGTIAGVGISLVITGMFAQDPLWYIAFFALWIGATTAAGFKYRNFQSYGFVLAGYTLCIVALPVIETPLEVFDIAVSRFSEVVVGIICATVISDIVFPRRLLNSLIASERERFRDILSTLADPKSVFGRFDDADPTLSRFASGVVGLNAVRVNSNFESGADRKERHHYQQLNQEYMNLSTTYHSLKSILSAIRERHNREVLESLERLYAPIASLLETVPETVLTPEDLNPVIEKLLKATDTIERVSESEYGALLGSMDAQGEEEYVSAAYLIGRLLEELRHHCETYRSLLQHRISGHGSGELNPVMRFSTHTDTLLVGLAALRGSGVLLLSMAFWIETAWPFATLTITLAVVIGLLLGTLPSPLDGVRDFFKGAVVALILAGIYDFYLIPAYTSDLLTLALLLAPVLAFVGWMTTRPKLAIFAFGFVFMFMTQCALDPYYKIDPTHYLESSLASLIGIVFGGVAYLLVNFWSCSLTQQRVATILRRQIVKVCDGPLTIERSALESTGRDLVQQFSTQGRLNMRSSRLVYEWLLSTLEIGRSILAVRQSLLRLDPRHRRGAIQTALESLQSFFESPSRSGREGLLNALRDCLQEVRSANMEQGDAGVMERLRIELALIRTVVLNSATFPLYQEDACR